MKKILILKTGSTIGPLLEAGEDFENWIVSATTLSPDLFIVVSVFKNEPLPLQDELIGIIVTGSPAYVTDHETWSEVAADYLRQAVETELPVLGICYGHQLLAYCLGGEVGFHPRGREIGSVSIELAPQARHDKLMNALPDNFLAQVSHQQSVIRLPAQAELLASSAFEPHHAFRVGEWAWGLQFHPEFSASIIAAYLSDRQQALLQEGLDPGKLRDQVEETPQAASLLGVFAAIVMTKAGSQTRYQEPVADA